MPKRPTASLALILTALVTLSSLPLFAAGGEPSAGSAAMAAAAAKQAQTLLGETPAESEGPAGPVAQPALLDEIGTPKPQPVVVCSLWPPECPCSCIQQCEVETNACLAACDPSDIVCKFHCRLNDSCCVDVCCGTPPQHCS